MGRIVSSSVADHLARTRAVFRAIAGASIESAPDAAALAFSLAEALSAPPVDFAEVARRWVALQGLGGIRPATGELLSHLATQQRPPVPGDLLTSLVGLPLALPVALATFGSPRDLLGTAYHAARLTSADERVTWGTVGCTISTVSSGWVATTSNTTSSTVASSDEVCPERWCTR